MLELVEDLAFQLTLAIPFLGLLVRHLSGSRINRLWLFLFSSFLVYGFSLIEVHLIDIRLNQELSAFDLNGDGFFSGSELTPAQEEAMSRVTSDTARNLAPVTAAIFAPIYVVLVLSIAEATRVCLDLFQGYRVRT